MAVASTPMGDKLVVKFVDGTTDEGKPKIKSRTYSNVKPAAADQDIYDVASAIYSLQTKVVNSVIREKSSSLINA